MRRGKPTVEIRADVQHPSLAAGNRLSEAEQSSAKRGDAFLRQHFGCVERGPRRGNFDAVAVTSDASSGKLLVVKTGMGKCRLGVVRLGGQGLEEDSAANVGNVFLAHQHGHACIDGEPSLAFEFFGCRREQLGVGFIP